MLRILPTIRDFMNEETKKYLPGNLVVENCIILTKHEKNEKERTLKTHLYIFDHTGTLIGKIIDPEFIPLRK